MLFMTPMSENNHISAINSFLQKGKVPSILAEVVVSDDEEDDSPLIESGTKGVHAPAGLNLSDHEVPLDVLEERQHVFTIFNSMVKGLSDAEISYLVNVAGLSTRQELLYIEDDLKLSSQQRASRVKNVIFRALAAFHSTSKNTGASAPVGTGCYVCAGDHKARDCPKQLACTECGSKHRGKCVPECPTCGKRHRGKCTANICPHCSKYHKGKCRNLVKDRESKKTQEKHQRASILDSYQGLSANEVLPSLIVQENKPDLGSKVYEEGNETFITLGATANTHPDEGDDFRDDEAIIAPPVPSAPADERTKLGKGIYPQTPIRYVVKTTTRTACFSSNALFTTSVLIFIIGVIMFSYHMWHFGAYMSSAVVCIVQDCPDSNWSWMHFAMMLATLIIEKTILYVVFRYTEGMIWEFRQILRLEPLTPDEIRIYHEKHMFDDLRTDHEKLTDIKHMSMPITAEVFWEWAPYGEWQNWYPSIIRPKRYTSWGVPNPEYMEFRGLVELSQVAQLLNAKNVDYLLDDKEITVRLRLMNRAAGAVESSRYTFLEKQTPIFDAPVVAALIYRSLKRDRAALIEGF